MNEDSTISRDYEDAFEALFEPDVAQLRRTRAYALRHLRAELQALTGTQKQIADKLGIKQPRLNKILRGDAAAISLDNVVQLSARIGLRAEVVFSKQRSSAGSSFGSALAQADRHCDMEGLPPPSGRAKALDREVAAGRIASDQAVKKLVSHHKKA
jgi:predicted XRE-type DNA-binding protein